MPTHSDTPAGGAPALASMTAFARASATIAQGTIVWELKSVNAKGLDIRLRLPPGFDAQDAPCRAMIAAAVARGTVNATLTMQRTAATPQVRVDAVLLRALVEAITAAVPEASRVGPASLDGLLAIRGVVEISDTPDPPEDQAALAVLVATLLASALQEFQAVRRSEGAALGRLLGDHLAAITASIAAAEAAPGRTPEAALARLRRSVDALAGSATGLDPDRLHQEAILLATRADVREELDRLDIHRRSAEALLAAGGPAGRRLDFLSQELAREANTLCAKSGDAALTAIGLDLRTRIEQFREQVQNLE